MRHGMDGFPIDPDAPEAGLHLELDDWLAHASARQYPVRYAHPDSEIERTIWLKLVLERIAWMRGRDSWTPDAKQRHARLASFATLVLNRVRYLTGVPPDATTLILLAECLPAVEGAGSAHAREDAAPLLLKEKQWPAELRIALHKSLRVLGPDSSPHYTAGRALAWRLFMDPDDPDDGEPCWSATVRRAVRAMPGAEGKRWKSLLDLASGRLSMDPTPKWRPRVEAAAGRVGLDLVEQRSEEWLAGLAGKPVLGFAGQVLLAYLIVIAEITGALRIRRALAKTTEARWDSPRTISFVRPLLARLVAVLASPPALNEAIERLATQEWAEGVPEVSRAGQEILRESYAADEGGGEGIDGYPFPGDQPARKLHQRIDGLLRSRESRDYDGIDARVQVSMLLHGDSGIERELLNAVSNRLDWLAAHMPDQAAAMREWARFMGWHSDMAALRAYLLRAGTEANEEEMIRALEGNAGESVFQRIVQYTEKQGCTPAILEAVRRFHKGLYGTVADQTLRRHVGWWLWLNDVAQAGRQDCWSSVVRTGINSMPAEKRTKWVRLLSNISFAFGGKIPAKWTKQARPLLDSLGAAEFRTQLLAWFAPFRAGTPLKLTSEGGDALRNLVWYCSLLPPDGGVDQALQSIRTAPWKNQQSRDRLAKVLPATDEVLLGRGSAIPVRATPKSAPAPKKPDASTILRLALAPLGIHAVVNEDHLLVSGIHRRYRIGFDGSITDEQGRRWRIEVGDLQGPPGDYIRSSVDSFDMVNGPFAVNLPLLAYSAVILSNDLEHAACIHEITGE